MAPVKFDKNVKEQLEKRTIQPSSDAWGKLSKRLDAEEQTEKKASYWWLGIAASIIGIVLVATQFFNNNTKEIIPQVVDNPSKVEEIKIIKEPIKVVSETQKIVSIKKEDKVEVSNTPAKLKEEIDLEEKTIEIATNKSNLEDSKIIHESTEVLEEKLSFEEQKIQDIVMQVHNLKEQNKEVSDTEIEALLQQAQQEIAFKKLYNESTGLVDANALLQDVEEELDKSFRTRVFEALKKSYGTVKTAVAQRND